MSMSRHESFMEDPVPTCLATFLFLIALQIHFNLSSNCEISIGYRAFDGSGTIVLYSDALVVYRHCYRPEDCGRNDVDVLSGGGSS